MRTRKSWTIRAFSMGNIWVTGAAHSWQVKIFLPREEVFFTTIVNRREKRGREKNLPPSNRVAAAYASLPLVSFVSVERGHFDISGENGRFENGIRAKLVSTCEPRETRCKVKLISRLKANKAYIVMWNFNRAIPVRIR